MNFWRNGFILALLCVAIASHAAIAAAPDPAALLGSKLAAPELRAVTDRTLARYFGGLFTVSETHADDCGATMRIESGQLPLSGALLALRRVSDCAGPKPILALRFTVTQAGASAVEAAMRPALGKPCEDGPGAMGAPSLIWADAHRVLGVVEDKPPSTAFSVFYVNQEQTGSSDPGAEQGLRRMLEADLPAGCR